MQVVASGAAERHVGGTLQTMLLKEQESGRKGEGHSKDKSSVGWHRAEAEWLAGAQAECRGGQVMRLWRGRTQEGPKGKAKATPRPEEEKDLL